MSLPSDARPCCFVLTGDRARARAFYEGVLGLRAVAEDDFAVTYDLAGTPMRLTSHAGHQPTPHTVLGWNVGDIRSAVAALQAKGVRFTVYDGFGQDADGVWTAPGGGARVAWFPDPDGNVLSLTQIG